MFFGKVVGTVVSTQKDEGMEGFKLLMVQHLSLDPENSQLLEKDSYVIAVDAVGAGHGDVVFGVAGSSARMTQQTLNRPVDNVISGIIDYVEVGGQMIYRKEADGA